MRLQGLGLPETTPSTPLKIHTDASHQEDGMSFVGWVFNDHNGRTLDISGDALGKGWDSVGAEMEAITRVLDGISHYKSINHIKIYTDCKPAIHNLGIKDYDLEKHHDNVSLEWIPREDNKLADMVADGWMVKHWSPPERKITRL